MKKSLQYQVDSEKELQEYLLNRNLTRQVGKTTFQVGMPLRQNYNQSIVTRQKRQMQNDALKHSHKTGSTLQTSLLNSWLQQAKHKQTINIQYFLLKKNINKEIIRAIMAYSPTQVPKSLEQWKMAIIAVGQEYEWTNIHYNYRTSSGITYGGMGKPMEIRQ